MAKVAGSSPAGRTIATTNRFTKESTMRAKPVAMPVVKPRNRVVIALALLARVGSGRHSSVKRSSAKNQKDLADRVRECGEW